MIVSFLVPCTYAMDTGDRLPTFKIADQFAQEHVLSADTRTIIVASDKKTSEIVRAYLLAKEKEFLEKKSAYYLADISGMPGFIADMFALPKMKECPFPILLVDEEQTKTFLKKDAHITVYTIENGRVLSVAYIKTKEELAAIFE
ncbi:MAG: hypothetical protein CR981_04815 [Proteobacteria bacterium]|nr:MAG: hypothetical protein CR981_04815 [Pseudomonadota bacterium]